MFIKYPYRAMEQGSVDMVAAHKQVADLTNQLQDAMRRLMAAWQSQQGSQDFQQFHSIWNRASDEHNAVLNRRADALDGSQIEMRRADQGAANAARDC